MAPRTRRSANQNNAVSSIKHTVEDCLNDLGITSNSVFDDCDSLEDEFRVVKKIYFAGRSAFFVENYFLYALTTDCFSF
jgi:hypothetical protein